MPYDDGTPYNEADTRAKLIDPALKAAGWDEDLISREHYYNKNKKITAGRIYLTGEKSNRREPKKVDYILRFHGEMVTLVEAKEESESVDAGLGQARGYAEDLSLLFAYSANGHGFAEWDAFLNQITNPCDPFPSPTNLWDRLQNNKGIPTAREGGPPIDQRRHPLLYPPCPEQVTGKELRYYQEAALTAAIERMLRGQTRILLTLATGTGKTFIAFQLVWKLRRSGWLTKPVLFLADRLPLRNQAFNTFGPFAQQSADPREVIEHGDWNQNRELYFALYQSLDAGDTEPLFERIPEDFFGLIVIDECHRSGFGKWNRILQRFASAVHLGMTATPKRSDNVDTYAYFCSEEPEAPVDPDDPSKGSWRPPAFTYSLGRGIDDGFLATYKVHKVRTTVDKDGIRLEDAQAQGAEIFVPEDVTPRELYNTAHFERAIRLPDRTAAIADHLTELLQRFEPMAKTMVFCVDVQHARLVASLLQNNFASLGYADYAVPIVSEEPEAMARLERFQDSDQPTPVVATTAELLTTGVDVPACKNIVFIKPLASQVLFKQIIGRGSRVDEATNKEWFRIIDYVGASRLFDDWDRPPGEAPPEIPQARTSAISITVVEAETGLLIVGASVTALIGPNLQVGPYRTDHNGVVTFIDLPALAIRVAASASGYIGRSVTVETADGESVAAVLELKPQTQPPQQIRVRGLEVTIADEATFLVEATGDRLTLDEYSTYAAARVRGICGNLQALQTTWTDSNHRSALLEQLENDSVQLGVIRDLLGHVDVDEYDLIASLAYGQPVIRRAERAEAVKTVHTSWFESFARAQREVIEALLDQWVRGGMGEFETGEVFRLEPFLGWGQAPGVAERFGRPENLREALRMLVRHIYEVS
jgi:type I restriction enzyme R subunit